jgi:uncharacterized protein YybS (DUF2232 family)
LEQGVAGMTVEFNYSDYWRFPFSIVYAYLLGVGLYILNTYYPNSALILVSTQLRVVSSAILFAQGLSLTWFVADRYKIHPIMKWLIFLIAAFTQAFSLIALLGAVDSRFDIRKWVIEWSNSNK